MLHKLKKDDQEKLSSQQVITELKDCIKELIENSLDAESSNIIINLGDNGSSYIEVIDNGSGIIDLDKIGGRGNTSKLENFESLNESLNTLGFRGEGLNSIINSCKSVVIETCIKEDKGITRSIYFDKANISENRNTINNHSWIIGESGTKVLVTGFFYLYIARRKLFLQQNKLQLKNLITLIEEYAICYPKVRFLLTNTMLTNEQRTKMGLVNDYNYSKYIEGNLANNKNNSTATLIMTSGSHTTTELKVAKYLWGDSLLEDAIEIDIHGELSIPKYRYNKNVDNYNNSPDIIGGNWSITGFISSIDKGRPSSDYQIYIVNNRPVSTLRTFSRAITSIHRTLSSYINKKWYPVFVLKISLPSCLLDINVTPDKRIILLPNNVEILLIDKLQSFLVDKLQNTIPMKKSNIKVSRKNNTSQENGKEPINIQNCRDNEGKSSCITTCELKNKDNNINSDIDYKDSPNNETTDKNIKDNVNLSQSYMSQGLKKRRQLFEVQDEKLSEDQHYNNTKKSIIYEWSSYDTHEIITNNKTFQIKKNSYLPQSTIIEYNYNWSIIRNRWQSIYLNDEKSADENITKHTSYTPNINLKNCINISEKNFLDEHNNECVELSPEVIDYSESQIQNMNYITNNKTHKGNSCNKSINKTLNKCFQFQKHLFNDLKIVGQFNKGFILATLFQPEVSSFHLFIIDQHAADEKTKFEKYNNDLRNIQTQKLLSPLPMTLTPAQEQTALTYKDIFESNGFKYVFNTNSTIGKRIQLTQIPIIMGSPLQQFDFLDLLTQITKYKLQVNFTSHDSINIGLVNVSKQIKNSCTDTNITSSQGIKNLEDTESDDEEDVVIVINQGANTKSTLWCPTNRLPRPQRLWSILASKACRRAVMVGDDLNLTQMSKIIYNMSTLKSPWNCPHGRPSIRHLGNLTDI
ncbi:DNA mismatch repair protein, putative [Cryptosporidium muris RN66]|uniref:DNA mismatch repair protein, putative n=1 Tax=Cryptosporidium muris (strain RN66) TaxID=441375 RepID=B6AE36_CRYMR|nr:DNA mismatch repair protein, putative [Cryptosporidium muris RN66]EEA06477.1 DNA mismatch repair protein, putative [Cryptosporidium muris RN66]|eukprot:XP_002140826.1 DNA mismatch repair protein [Cryptosporidium muris RN66]